MRIHCIGGGPAGLYFAILMKKARPRDAITVFERNRPDDTFGWGVVFSDETLEHFRESDRETFEEIARHFVDWQDIETVLDVPGESAVRVRSTGHGFCGLSRKKLLQILQERCRGLGVELAFLREVADEAALGQADLIVAADGANSLVRMKYAADFEPQVRWGKCKFAWFGTTRPLGAFTFVFRETRHGLFQVHAYPFQRAPEALSTWIVECREEVWQRAGLSRMTEEESRDFCQELFAEELAGHPLLTNRSIWRSFPTIQCARWHHGSVVLLGDAAHTAHFSIGSGTKLALEDAIALEQALREHAPSQLSTALAVYEEARRLDVLKLQKAAQTSREWFENSARYLRQPPLQFMFNLMTRSMRITYDNLQKRDPDLVARVSQWWWGQTVAPLSARPPDAAPQNRNGPMPPPPPMFAPLELRGLRLANRVVVSPMCQYSARDGIVGDWHLVHLGSRAIGGAGLVFTEMTDVSAEGRITYGCAGMYTDEHEAAWKRIVDFVHESSRAKIGMQLAHAGRKGSCNLPWEGDDPLPAGKAWTTLAPSAVPFDRGWHVPKAMDRGDLERVRGEFAGAAARADRAGFDVLELHMAHGYLLSSFLSPKSNFRTDEYGGSLENRMRFPLEVFEAVRAVWPREKPIAVRITATDWLDDDGGWTLDDSVEFAGALKHRGCDLIDVSSAGNTPQSKPVYGRMYQVPFAERIRAEALIPVMAVGGIQGADHVNSILVAGRADLCALARPHLVRPYLTLEAAAVAGYGEHAWPNQYLPAKPGPRN